MKKFYIFALCVMLASMAFVVTGCGQKTAEKVAEKAIEKATNGQADVDIGTNTVKINTNGSSYQAGGDVELPSGFPSDVYVIDGKLTSVSTYGDDGFTISLETTKTAAEVKEKYDSQLKEDGWTIKMSLAYENGASVSAEKDNRTVTMSVDGSSGKMIVVITTAPKTQ